MPAFRAAGRESPPSRASRTDGALHPMQQAFLDAQAFQCGFCAAGMIMTGRRARRGAAGRPAARAQGQSLPLHRLPLDRRRPRTASRHRGGRRRPGLRRQPAQSVQPRRSSPGHARYTMDVAMEGLLHLKVLRSPHAHARITAHRPRARRWRVPGVVAVFTWEDVPRRLYSTATHEDHLVDPDDTYMLDNVVRFVGQRVAAVVAETEARGRGRLPAARGRLRAPAGRVRSGGRHGARTRRSCTTRAAQTNGNIYVDIHGEVGSVADGFAAADAIHETTYSTSRVQHVHLETHGSIAWTRRRTAAPRPHQLAGAVHRPAEALPTCSGCARATVHVFTERVGGGFGGKQEMVSEDLCVLATLKTGRPGEVGVHPRGAVHRRHDAPPDDHQGQARRQAGRHADRDRRARGLQHRRLWRPCQRDAGGRARQPAHGLSLRRTRRPHGYAVYTNMVPGGGFRGYGASQTTFAIECAIDELARQLGIDPFAIRRKNMVRPGDWIESVWKDPSDVEFRQLRSRPVPRPRRARAGERAAARPKPDGDEWLEGTGMRAGHAGMRPADRASLGRRDDACCPTAATIWPSARPRWATARSPRTGRSPPPCSARAPAEIDIINADTDRAPYDTGTFASTGTVVAGKAVALTAAAHARQHPRLRQPPHRRRPRPTAGSTTTAVICGNQRIPLRELHAAGTRGRPPLRGQAQGLSVAAHRRLQRAWRAARRASRHRRDPHPAQRARRRHRPADQPDAVPRPDRRRHRDGHRLGADREHGPRRHGNMVNPALRNYRIPAFADVPPSEVFFADTYDTIGPLGAKSQGECAINPVAPAIANALANATGVRFAHLPFTPDRIFDALGAAP